MTQKRHLSNLEAFVLMFMSLLMSMVGMKIALSRLDFEGRTYKQVGFAKQIMNNGVALYMPVYQQEGAK